LWILIIYSYQATTAPRNLRLPGQGILLLQYLSMPLLIAGGCGISGRQGWVCEKLMASPGEDEKKASVHGKACTLRTKHANRLIHNELILGESCGFSAFSGNLPFLFTAGGPFSQG
jgi:hypothetical protein